MSNTIFIIGGARSGKSGYALELGSEIPGRKGFLATAEALDEEMKQRILLHQEARPSEWETIEEPIYLSKRLHDISGLYDVVIVDCLTLWLSNMLGRGEDSEPPRGNIDILRQAQDDNHSVMEPCHSELVELLSNHGVFSGERIKTEIVELASVLKDIRCKVIVVSNEVGLGIVPENKMARLFRDLGGWMNQKVAAAAGEVYLVTCGIPVKIKG